MSKFRVFLWREGKATGLGNFFTLALTVQYSGWEHLLKLYVATVTCSGATTGNFVVTQQVNYMLCALLNIRYFATHFSSSSDLFCWSALARAMAPVEVTSLLLRL